MGHVIMIHYNSPAHARERQEVRPLSMDEMETVVEFLNFKFNGRNPAEPGMQLLQRLIFEHENLQHMRETQPKWISVEDALPINDKLVTVWLCNKDNPHWNTYRVGTYQNNKWYLDFGTSEGDYVTHWMPLPPAPPQPNNIEVNEPENMKP